MSHKGHNDRTAWAIATVRIDDPPLIGVGRFSSKWLAQAWTQGFTLATFRTRASARACLSYVKGPTDQGKYPDAHVVKIKILIDIAE